MRGGEGGTTPALSAVVNAILDATWDLGVRDITMPATPAQLPSRRASSGNSGMYWVLVSQALVPMT